MLKISTLKPFIFYRNNLHFIMYEDVNNPRKNTLISVLAPNIDKEFAFLDDISDHFVFRYLDRTYIERFTTSNFKGHGKIRVKNNPVDIHTLLDAHKTKDNLKNVNNVIIDPKLIKGFNTIYNLSHCIDGFMNNEKDGRIASVRGPELMSLIKTYMTDNLPTELQSYNKTIFLPINMWLTPEEYHSPLILNKNHTNFFSMFYNQLLENDDLFKGFDWNIIVSNYNEMMIIDLDKYYKDRETSKIESLAAMLLTFIKKCKSNSANIEKTPEEGTEDDLAKAKLESKASLETEKALEAAKIEDISLVEKQKINDIITTEIKEKGKFDVSKVDTADVKTIEDLDRTLKASMSGKSIQNMRRNEMLKEDMKNKTINGKTLQHILEEQASNTIEDKVVNINTVNDKMKILKSQNFEASYNKTLYYADLMSILTFFSTKSPALYLIDDVTEEDVSDTFNKLFKYTVSYEDETRKRYKFSFLLPKFYQDRYLFLNENKKDITHQLFPYPITKTDKDRAQLCTNYNKIFISRVGGNVSPKITKLKKFFTNPSSGIKSYLGDSTIDNNGLLTTIEYDEFSSKFYKLNIYDTTIVFKISDASALIGENYTDERIPLGINNKTKTKYFFSGTTNIVYDNKNKEYGEICDFLISLVSQNRPKFADEFSDITSGSKFVYSSAMILGKDVPLILVLCTACHGGLLEVMERANINYELSDKRPRDIDQNNKGIVAFSDMYIIYDRYPYQNSLLMNGLGELPLKEYTLNQMMDKETYTDFFDLLYNERKLVEGIENFRQLMIDPITIDVLKKQNYPTDFVDLCIIENGLLVDNQFMSTNDYRNYRLRSNEIVMVYLYQALADAYQKYRVYRETNRFTIPEDAVIKELLKSHIIDEHSSLNLSLEQINDRQVKMKGPVGLNVDQAYTIDKRAYHKSMTGVSSMSTTPTGEVGVRRQLTLNYNVTNPRGFLDLEKDEYDGTELLSPVELSTAFGVEASDPQRVAYTTIQASHLVATEKMTPTPVSYDFDRVAPHISSDFAAEAKQDGEVIEISNDVMIVKYKDGSYDDVDLSFKPMKNSNGGFYITNKLETELKIGSKFKSGEILAYNPKHISPKDDFGDNIAMGGCLARVAFVATGHVHEDSMEIVESLSQKLSTKVTIQMTKIVTQFSNIKYIAKKGSPVSVNDPLLVFDDSKDEFSSKLLFSLAEENEDDDDINYGHTNLKSKVKGVVSDVRIYYTVPIEEMTKSLQDIINDYNKENQKREKTISKYIDPKKANTILTPSKYIEPDINGKVKGVKIDQGILIEFYVEYTDKMSVGDKTTNNSALKGIVNDVIPTELAPYGLSNPDRPIEAFVSEIGLFKRMVHDVSKGGAINKILVDKKRLLKNKYYDKL